MATKIIVIGRDCVAEYRSMSPPLQRALVVLHAVREKAAVGIGNHLATGCPVFHATGVGAQYWYHLSQPGIEKMIARGWTEEAYTAFMDWYDDLPDRNLAVKKSKDEFLLWFLSLEDIGPLTAA